MKTLLLLFALTSVAMAQGSAPNRGKALPGGCTVGDIFALTQTDVLGNVAGLYTATSAGPPCVWAAAGATNVPGLLGGNPLQITNPAVIGPPAAGQYRGILGDTVVAAFSQAGNDVYDVSAYGALGNCSTGTTSVCHPVSNWCTNHGGTRFTAANDGACLTAIQAVYPAVTTLTNEIDWAATEAAIADSENHGAFSATILFPSVANGCYAFDTIVQANGSIIAGTGSPGSCIVYYGTTYAIYTPININSYTIKDIDFWITNLAGGAIEIGDNFRHILISQVNIWGQVSASATGTCIETGDGGGFGGIDILMVQVRCQGFNNGFDIKSTTSANSFTCIVCYANQPHSVGFLDSTGIKWVTLINPSSDNAGVWGYQLQGSPDGKVDVIDPECENAVSGCYVFTGQKPGESIEVINPDAFQAGTQAYRIQTAPYLNLHLVNPTSTGTTGTNAITTSGGVMSLTIDGGLDGLDKGADATTLAILNQNIGNKLQSASGSLSIPQLGTPVAPTPVCAGACAGGTWSYAVVAFDYAGNATAASPNGSATNATTLTTTNKNNIKITPVAGAAKYNVYRTASAGTPANLSLLCAGMTSANTGFNRDAACVDDGSVNTASVTPSAVNSTGFLGLNLGQAQKVITTNYTTSATTLATAGVIPGLNYTGPTSAAKIVSFSCNLIYSQATAAAANLWGITTTGTAPTSLLATAAVLTSNAGVQVNGTAIISSATSTTLVTATPSAFGPIGTAADMFQAQMWGTADIPSNSTPASIGLSVASGNASDALTIYRGSFCNWF